MIKSITLKNFFGFRDCTINLESGENVCVAVNVTHTQFNQKFIHQTLARLSASSTTQHL
ncbi:MAG: hypothetical protein SH856_01350 [Flavobacteriales bacterium]|nr:hypothetical protein [Flavobacteriales bacterium]